MYETAVALLLGHMLADFTMQTDAMVRRKREPLVLLSHVGVVAGMSWLALGAPFAAGALAAIGFIAVTHYAIDWAKIHLAGPGLRPFLLDQAAHLAAIAAAAALWPGAWAAGFWPALEAAAPLAARLPEAMALAAGLVATVWAGGYGVAALMTGVELPVNAESLPRGGRIIGRLERLVILMLVLAGQPDGIGFLIAAKSILRFNELAGAADRHVSEYVIIGTLASFAWAMATSYATLGALRLLAGS